MRRYAVAFKMGDAYWIEWYDAEDSEHAWEQANDANPEATILCTATDYRQ